MRLASACLVLISLCLQGEGPVIFLNSDRLVSLTPILSFARWRLLKLDLSLYCSLWHYHISPVLRDLHRLPLRQRITFKIATLMHHCLNGLAPSYLATDWIAISSMPGRRQLRSAASGQPYIPRTKTMTFGPRSFKVSGPTIWNDLPARLKDSSLSKNSFRKLLKTFLLFW